MLFGEMYCLVVYIVVFYIYIFGIGLKLDYNGG